LEQRKHNLENEINELQNLVAQREARAEKARRDLDAIRARKDASKE
jgi:cell division protein FtsB